VKSGMRKILNIKACKHVAVEEQITNMNLKMSIIYMSSLKI